MSSSLATLASRKLFSEISARSRSFLRIAVAPALEAEEVGAPDAPDERIVAARLVGVSSSAGRPFSARRACLIMLMARSWRRASERSVSGAGEIRRPGRTADRAETRRLRSGAGRASDVSDVRMRSRCSNARTIVTSPLRPQAREWLEVLAAGTALAAGADAAGWRRGAGAWGYGPDPWGRRRSRAGW